MVCLACLELWQGGDGVVLQAMLKSSLQPDKVTYATLIHGWVEIKNMPRAQIVLETMLKANVRPDKIIFGTLLSGFGRVRDAEGILFILESARQHQAALQTRQFNLAIWGLTVCKRPQESCHIFRQMIHQGHAPDSQTWQSLPQQVRLGPCISGVYQFIHTFTHVCTC